MLSPELENKQVYYSNIPHILERNWLNAFKMMHLEQYSKYKCKYEEPIIVMDFSISCTADG